MIKKVLYYAQQILRRLKFDNESISEISILVKEHMNVLDKTNRCFCKTSY